MEENFRNLKMKISKTDFAIVKSKKIYQDAFANIKDNKKITVIIEESKIDKKDIINIENNWRIIAISSYSTDHILVKNKDLDKTIYTLEKLGIKT